MTPSARQGPDRLRLLADKFERSGFTPQAADTVRPQRIAECPIQFEAKVVAAHAPGGHWPEDRPSSFRIIEAQVTRVHAQPDIVIPGTDHIDISRWSPLLHMFRHYFGIGRSLGSTFKPGSPDRAGSPNRASLQD